MIEATYRRALRWYSADWRSRNEDVVVGALLDNADHEGRSAPGRGELRGIAAAGLAERLLGSDRRTVSMGIGLALAVVLAVWYPAVIAWSPGSRFVGSLGWFSNPVVLVSIPIALAAILFVLGQSRFARLAVIVAMVAVAAIGLAAWSFGWMGPGPSAVVLYVGVLGVSLSRGDAWRSVRLLAALGCALATSLSILLVIAQFGAVGALSLWVAVAVTCVAPLVGLALLLAPSRQLSTT
jgi:hypothetical protein